MGGCETRWAVFLAVAVCWCSPATGQEPAVKLPAEVQAKPGRLLKLEAETKGKIIRWHLCSDDADLIVSESGRWAIFCAPEKGRFLVLAWTAAGDVPSEAAVCVVVVGQPSPPPPPPPPPPDPADPLTKSLQAAWAAEGDAKRDQYRKDLAALYQQAGTTTVNDASLKTVGQLSGVMRKAASSLMPDTALPKVRLAIQAYFKQTLPTAADTALDVGTRALCGRAFTRVGKVLEGLP